MKYSLLIFCFVSLINGISQSHDIEKKDSLLFGHYLPDLEVTVSNANFVKKWNRTKFYVKSVYDYAKIASAMLTSYEDTLSKIDGRYAKKKYLSKCNKTLKKEFGKEIK